MDSRKKARSRWRRRCFVARFGAGLDHFRRRSIRKEAEKDREGEKESEESSERSTPEKKEQGVAGKGAGRRSGSCYLLHVAHRHADRGRGKDANESAGVIWSERRSPHRRGVSFIRGIRSHTPEPAKEEEHSPLLFSASIARTTASVLKCAVEPLCEGESETRIGAKGPAGGADRRDRGSEGA